jgi:hypothetical protein
MNRLLMHVLATTMLGASLGGCGNSNPESAEPVPRRDVTFDLAAMRSKIESRNRAFTNAHVIGDSAATINIFAEDARVLPPNSAPVIGRRAIAELNAQYLAAGITEFREETIEFYRIALKE